MKLNLNRGIKGALFGGVVLLAGTGVIGCSNKEDVPSTPSLLEGTILEDTYVITDSNADIFIVRPTESYQGDNFNTLLDTDGCVNHYIDVLSNNCYHEKTFEEDVCRLAESGVFSIDIEQQKPISVYLTKEDLLKSEFSEEDIVEIIQRAKDDSSNNENVTAEEKGLEYTK